MVERETIHLKARDGYPLVSVYFPKQTQDLKGRIIIASATGVPQRFYRKLAEFFSTRGYDVWTLDYRGIGLSKPKTLAGFEMNYLDWARLDLNSLIDLVSSGSEGRLFLVGHSYGGHAIGLIEQPERFEKFVTFGIGAGWAGWMPQLERLRVTALWNIAGPLLVTWKGYLAWSVLGLGEDLPKNVFWQWKQWASYPHYFFDDPSMKNVAALYDRVHAPIFAINSVDDKWATPKSREAFLKGFRNAQITTLDVSPKELGLKSIGHVNYFRPEAKALWEKALAYLERE